MITLPLRVRFWIPPIAFMTYSGGICPPSCQVTLIRLPPLTSEPGISHRTRTSVGQLSSFAPEGPKLSTVSGASRFRPRYQGWKMWQPMSPMFPQPNPSRARHIRGWYSPST